MSEIVENIYQFSWRSGSYLCFLCRNAIIYLINGAPYLKNAADDFWFQILTFWIFGKDSAEKKKKRVKKMSEIVENIYQSKEKKRYIKICKEREYRDKDRER